MRHLLATLLSSLQTPQTRRPVQQMAAEAVTLWAEEPEILQVA